MKETIDGIRHRPGRAIAVALGLGVAIAAQAAPASAQGAQTFHYSFNGETAEARFYLSDGCVGTEALVHAVEGRVRSGSGRPDALSAIFVAVTRFDICTHQPLGFALGFREDLGDALEIDRLDGAAVTTTVEMTDMSTGVSSAIHVDLRWSGAGEAVTAREHIMLDYPGFRVNARESGTARVAHIGGMLSDGTVDYIAGAWAWGRLSSIRAGEVAVLH